MCHMWHNGLVWICITIVNHTITHKHVLVLHFIARTCTKWDNSLIMCCTQSLFGYTVCSQRSCSQTNPNPHRGHLPSMYAGKSLKIQAFCMAMFCCFTWSVTFAYFTNPTIQPTCPSWIDSKYRMDLYHTYLLQ